MLLPSGSLLDITEKYHLLPLAIFFAVVGAISTLSILIRFLLGFTVEVVDTVYDSRARWAESRERFQKRLSSLQGHR